jgi:hypothetical protein
MLARVRRSPYIVPAGLASHKKNTRARSISAIIRTVRSSLNASPAIELRGRKPALANDMNALRAPSLLLERALHGVKQWMSRRNDTKAADPSGSAPPLRSPVDACSSRYDRRGPADCAGCKDREALGIVSFRQASNGEYPAAFEQLIRRGAGDENSFSRPSVISGPGPVRDRLSRFCR